VAEAHRLRDEAQRQVEWSKGENDREKAAAEIAAQVQSEAVTAIDVQQVA
jgi:hypothetical protein